MKGQFNNGLSFFLKFNNLLYVMIGFFYIYNIKTDRTII